MVMYVLLLPDLMKYVWGGGESSVGGPGGAEYKHASSIVNDKHLLLIELASFLRPADTG